MEIQLKKKTVNWEDQMRNTHSVARMEKLEILNITSNLNSPHMKISRHVHNFYFQPKNSHFSGDKKSSRSNIDLKNSFFELFYTKVFQKTDLKF